MIWGYPYFWKHPYLANSTCFLFSLQLRHVGFDATGLEMQKLQPHYICLKDKTCTLTFILCLMAFFLGLRKWWYFWIGWSETAWRDLTGSMSGYVFMLAGSPTNFVWYFLYSQKDIQGLMTPPQKGTRTKIRKNDFSYLFLTLCGWRPIL